MAGRLPGVSRALPGRPDTFAPERWHYIVEHANWSREWLKDLPRDVAEKIAYRNGEALFGNMPLK